MIGMGANGGLFSSSWSDLTGWLRGKPKEEDRRAEGRLPIHDLVQLHWTAEDQSKSVSANLIDVSSVGFKVRSAESVAVGARISLTDSTGKSAEAVVVYCEEDEDAYLIGAHGTWQAPNGNGRASAPAQASAT